MMPKISSWLLALHFGCCNVLLAQASVPYSTSTVQGTRIITNYYDPYATPAAGPGLTPSDVTTQFNQPLGKPQKGSALTPSPLFQSSSTALTPEGAAVPQYVDQSTLPAAGAAPSTPSDSFGERQRRAPVRVGALPLGVDRQGPQPLSFAVEPSYTYPGLLGRFGDKWLGSDYLYLLPENIGIAVEVVRGESTDIMIDPFIIKNLIGQIFSAKQLIPEALALSDKPPLPFFHLLIIATQTENSLFAVVSGRLFEQVELPRLPFPLPGTLQAITWEKQELISSSAWQFNDLIISTVAQIANDFVNQVEHFAQLREEQKSDIKPSRGGRVEKGGHPPKRQRIEEVLPRACR